VPFKAADVRRLPPGLVITADYDSLRDEGETYARRLADAGVTTTVTWHRSMAHGFIGMSPLVADADRAVARDRRRGETGGRAIIVDRH
jgi:acetyl esterase